MKWYGTVTLSEVWKDDDEKSATLWALVPRTLACDSLKLDSRMTGHSLHACIEVHDKQSPSLQAEMQQWVVFNIVLHTPLEEQNWVT